MIQKDIRDYFQKLANMKRFNNSIHIHEESVAEHSFFVTLYTYYLCKKVFNLSDETTYLAVVKALIHDVHECYLSDIPHNVKKHSKELENTCLKVEEKFNTIVFPEITEKINNNKSKDLIENIVNISDILSVKQFSEIEQMFGNGLFDKILKKADKRLEDEYLQLSRSLIKLNKRSDDNAEK